MNLLDEWAEKARQLAAHFKSEAAQRHARHHCHNLPKLEEMASVTSAHKSLNKAMRRLMLDMQLYGSGPMGAHAASALEALACALTAELIVEPAAEAPRPLHYNPGAGA